MRKLLLQLLEIHIESLCLDETFTTDENVTARA